MSHVGHLEWLALDRLLDQPAADGADGDADRLDRAVDLDLDPLQVRQEPPLGGAGNLAADAAEVLGLAPVALLVAADRLLAGDRTLHAHDESSSTARSFGTITIATGRRRASRSCFAARRSQALEKSL